MALGFGLEVAGREGCRCMVMVDRRGCGFPLCLTFALSPSLHAGCNGGLDCGCFYRLSTCCADTSALSLA